MLLTAAYRCHQHDAPRHRGTAQNRGIVRCHANRFFARFGGGRQTRQRLVVLTGSGLANRWGGGLGRPQCHAVDEPVAQHEGMKQDRSHVGGEGQKEQERQD